MYLLKYRCEIFQLQIILGDGRSTTVLPRCYRGGLTIAKYDPCGGSRNSTEKANKREICAVTHNSHPFFFFDGGSLGGSSGGGGLHQGHVPPSRFKLSLCHAVFLIDGPSCRKSHIRHWSTRCSFVVTVLRIRYCLLYLELETRYLLFNK